MRIGSDCHLDGQKQYYGWHGEYGSEITISFNFKTSSKSVTNILANLPKVLLSTEPFSKRINLNKKEGA